MFHITHIQVWGCNAPLPLYPISFPSRPLRFTSHLHPGRVSPLCRSSYLCLTSILVTSQLHPGPENCISALSRTISKLPRMLYVLFISIPVSQSCINCRSQEFCLNAIHVLSDLWQYPCFNIPPPCCISPPSRCRYSHLISIQIA